MSIITLTTDFGQKDYFVGALKGKILSELKEATLVDISHSIDLFNTLEASYCIVASYGSFPKGTIHIIGVDSERVGDTQHIALQWDDHFFICVIGGSQHNYRHMLINQRNRTMFHLSSWISLGMDVTDFLKFQCPF